MRAPLSAALRWALACSLLVLLAVGLRADPALQPTPKSPTLKDLSSMLKAEASALSQDLATLYASLDKAKTEAEGLKSSLTQSQAQLTSLVATLDAERQQASDTLMTAIDKGAAAEASRNRWRAAAVAGWVAAVLAAVVAVLH